MNVRINKFLAEQGVASRRAVDEMIVKGRVAVNGTKLTQPGYLVHENDTVMVDGKKIEQGAKNSVVILLNKPVDCITTSKDTHGRKTVLDYVRLPERIFPVGRLDKDTTGVLLLTNDGDLAHALMHPCHMIAKVYRAHVDKPFIEKDKKRFETGIVLDGRRTAPCQTRYFRNNKKDVIVTLHEGRNRQIHRMFNALGVHVEKLQRISYAGLGVGLLKEGEWRKLTRGEVERLKNVSFMI